MKHFKNILVIIALFTIGSTNTKQTGAASASVSSAASQPMIVSRPMTTLQPQSRITAPIATTDITTCLSGSVLPVYTKNGQRYAILTREGRGSPQAVGGKLHTYDDFSGQCEEEDNYDALLSASREFHEESNLQRSLGWSLEDTIKFVKENTINAIAFIKQIDPTIPGSREVKNFTYIVNFDAYADKLLNNFHPALEAEKEHYKKLGKNPLKQVTTEKDQIAIVLWEDLQGTISYQKIISAAQPAKVQALVKDEKGTKFHKETIVLRPILAIKLHSYFLNKPYTTSATDNRIRYYMQ